MPSGGDISIRVATVDGAEAGLSAGSFASIEVTDNGGGMAPEVAAKAFEPFFTTKDAGRGAGLGLAMVYGIATRAGGSASISTVAGVGTTITVLLPLSAESAVRAGHAMAHRVSVGP